MKEFFQNLLTSFNNLVRGKVDRHQKLLFLSVLVFGLITRLILSTISTIILMLVFGVLFEVTYCFVPFKEVKWFNHSFKIPDFNEFKKNYSKYLTNPKHNIYVGNYYYFYCSIIFFVILSILFLIF